MSAFGKVELLILLSYLNEPKQPVYNKLLFLIQAARPMRNCAIAVKAFGPMLFSITIGMHLSLNVLKVRFLLLLFKTTLRHSLCSTKRAQTPINFGCIHSEGFPLFAGYSLAQQYVLLSLLPHDGQPLKKAYGRG